MSAKDRLANYDFVVTTLWIGFLLAISFLEAPLRFQAEEITIPVALQIGRLVFHALNFGEIAFALWICFCHIRRGSSKKSNRLLAIAITILVVQTLLLFLVLDERTNAIIEGQEVEKTYHHTVYIGLETIKLVTLAFLAHSQIRDFKANLSTFKQKTL